MGSNSIVELQDVTKRYGESVVAVDAINLSVQRGEFLTLLGPSGCGKTTTLRMIAGLETVTSGKILINQEDVTFLPPYARNTSMMFQDYALFPHMSIEDNIAFGLKMRKVPREERLKKAREMLEFIQLPHIAGRKPNQLSGGQRQRVALVRSLILQPEVLLLDEPLGALDAELRRQMQVELKRNQQQLGITFIYVTHDQEEALSQSDRIVVMNGGYVEQMDTPKTIYEQPRTTFVASFIGRCNLRKGIVEAREGKSVVFSDAVLGKFPAACFNGMGTIQAGQSVTIALRPEKIRIGREAENCQTKAAGTLKYTGFLGSIVRIVVELAPGDEVVVEAQALPDAQVGEKVNLGWNCDDAIVLTENSGGGD